MKAIVLRAVGPPDALRQEDVPDPTPGVNDLVIQVAACGVCFHDVVCRNGTMKHGVSLPIVPGHEVAGRIVAMGGGVRGFRVGDRVATVSQRFTCGACRECRAGRENLCSHKVVLGDQGLNGGYADFVCVDQRSVARVPDEIDLEIASIIGCAVCCQLNAVRDVAHVRVGDIVVVTGAGGGVGVHGVQLARAAGGHVIAVTSSIEKAELLRKFGAHEVLLVNRGEDFSQRLRQATGDRGADVVIDNVGTPIFAATRRCIAVGGRWVLVGQLTGEFVPFNPAQLFLRGISMLSATGARQSQLGDALELVRRGDLKPVIAARFPLHRAAEAHAELERSSPLGRIVLSCRDPAPAFLNH